MQNPNGFQTFLHDLDHELKEILPEEERTDYIQNVHAHLTDLQDRFLAEGATEQEATNLALLEFGTTHEIKSDHRPNLWSLRLLKEEKATVAFYWSAAILATLMLSDRVTNFLYHATPIPSLPILLYLSLFLAIILTSIKLKRVLASHILLSFLAMTLLLGLSRIPEFATYGSKDIFRRSAVELLKNSTGPEKSILEPSGDIWLDSTGKHSPQPENSPQLTLTREQLESAVAQPIWTGVRGAFKLTMRNQPAPLVWWFLPHVIGISLGLISRAVKRRRKRT